jgi:hypothetical protein
MRLRGKSTPKAFGGFSSSTILNPRLIAYYLEHEDREPSLGLDMGPRIHAYLATVGRDLGAGVLRVDGVADRFTLLPPRSISHAQLIELIKENVLKSLPSASPPLPANGERIEVRASALFGRRVDG